MAIDPLAVSTGTNEGSAAILPESTFDPVSFSRQVGAEIAKQGQEKKHSSVELAKLLSHDVKSKWASDNVNYFSPKMEQLKKETIDTYKKNKGKLSDLQLFEVKNKWDKLQSEAEASNSLYKEEENRINDINDPKNKDAYEQEPSLMMRNSYNNPWQHPELKSEIEAAGGIIPWRVQNAHRFNNVLSYDYNKDIADNFKDKISTEYSRDEKGQLKSYKDKNGNIIYEAVEKVDPNKLQSHVKDFLGATTYTGGRRKKYANDFVENNIKIDENGHMTPLTEEGQKVIDVASSGGYIQGGMQPDKMKTGLAEAFVAQSAASRFPQKEVPKIEKPMKVTVNTGDKEKTTIPAEYNKIAQGVQQQIQKINPNAPSADQYAALAQAVNGKVIESSGGTGKHAVELPNPVGTNPFMMVPKGDILTVSRNKLGLRIGGYGKLASGGSGQIAGTRKKTLMIYKDAKGNQVTPSTPGAEMYIQVLLDPIKVDVNDAASLDQGYSLFMTQPDHANVSKEAYKQMLENAKDVKGDFKIEYKGSDPVAQSYLSQSVFGGNTVSNTQYNINKKASSSAPAKTNAPAKTKKETPAERASRIARGG